MFAITERLYATAWLGVGRTLNALLGDRGKVSVNDLVIKAVALALRRVPECNASWNGDAIRIFHRVHVGVAVAIEDGLITPVVRDADMKGIGAIAAEVKDLAARAKSRQLKAHGTAVGLPDDLIYPYHPELAKSLAIGIRSITKVWDYIDSAHYKWRQDGLTAGVFKADEAGHLYPVRPPIIVRDIVEPFASSQWVQTTSLWVEEVAALAVSGQTLFASHFSQEHVSRSTDNGTTWADAKTPFSLFSQMANLGSSLFAATCRTPGCSRRVARSR